MSDQVYFLLNQSYHRGLQKHHFMLIATIIAIIKVIIIQEWRGVAAQKLMARLQIC